MARTRSDIPRSQDLSEKVIIALVLALITCTGFHHFLPKPPEKRSSLRSLEAIETAATLQLHK